MNTAPAISISPPALPILTTPPLSKFSPVTLLELSSLIKGMRSTTCSLDPIPSILAKECLPAIAPLIITIINSSLNSGSVPDTLKLAAVTPILKKTWTRP